MTTDTTAVSFKFYDEGEDAKIALGVKVYGKLQENDLTFSLGFDPVRTTLPESTTSSFFNSSRNIKYFVSEYTPK